MDSIKKEVFLRAEPDRVWKALTDSSQFGLWFGARFDGPFVAGARVNAVIVGTTVSEKVAALQKPHEGTSFEISIEAVEPQRLFAFRWHPHAKGMDAAAEQTTLIEFTLTPEEGGTRLTIVESGFDQIPLARRATAFEANAAGWEMQLQLIETYLEPTA